MFIELLSFSGLLVSNICVAKCVSLNEQLFQVKLLFNDTNSNESNEFFIIYLLSVLINVVEFLIILMIYMLKYILQIK